MREIKFRAWDVSRERFQRGGSNLMIDMGGNKYWQFAFDAPEPLPREDGDKFILEQFTGLHDKSGVEIYEGDIIEFSSEMVSGERDVVAYRAGFYRNFTMFEQAEVIGNIHQNPELLERVDD